jgi:hypothetical protein
MFEQLIKAYVREYHEAINNLENAINEKGIDARTIEYLNSSLNKLKEKRILLITTLNEMKVVSISDSETRSYLKKVRDDDESYRNVLTKLAVEVYRALRMKKISPEEAQNLLKIKLFKIFRHEQSDTPLYEALKALNLTKEYKYERLINITLLSNIKDVESDAPEFLNELYNEIIKEDIEEYEGDTWVDKLDASIDFESINSRKREVGALICADKVPKRIADYFDEIKGCYMFGLFNAVIIFCLALIEESIEYAFNLKEGDLKDKIDKAKLPEEFKNKSHDIRGKRNRILHEGVLQQSELENIALSCIRDSMLIVEEIFNKKNNS